MSCCFVSADPLVGKKFSSSNETCKEELGVIFYKNFKLHLSLVLSKFVAPPTTALGFWKVKPSSER